MSRESEYWAERFVQLEDSNHRTADETMTAIDDAYRQASQDVERQLSAWYQRFADNNGIVDMSQARRLLNAGELKELKWTVEQYIQHGKENGVSADWSKELENASARFHVTRLEALKLNVQQSVEVLFGNQLDQMDLMMRQTYLGSYYHTAFLIQRGAGVGWDIAALNQNAIQAAINRPWATDGRNFSERIWSNKTALISELQRNLTQSLMTDNTCDKTINVLMKRFDVSHNQAARLVYTENAYIQAVAQGESYRENFVKKYQFIATLDDRTSDICRAMDGGVYDIQDYKPGETAPPLHPWCRSATAPYYEGLAGIGERAARDPETGQTYYLPRETKYEDWKLSFVGGGSKQGLTPVVSAPARVYSSAIANGLGKSHYDAMHDILDHCGSSDLRDVWEKYEADVGVADINERKRAHCDWNASIHVDLAGSANGSTWDKPYQTVFHESGHAIDMIAGRKAAGAASCHPNHTESPYRSRSFLYGDFFVEKSYRISAGCTLVFRRLRFICQPYALAGLHQHLWHVQRKFFGKVQRTNAVVADRKPLHINAVDLFSLMHFNPLNQLVQHSRRKLFGAGVLAYRGDEGVSGHGLIAAFL